VVRQGAFVHEGVITWRASEQTAPEPVLKVAEIPLKGAHNVENVLAAVCAAVSRASKRPRSAKR